MIVNLEETKIEVGPVGLFLHRAKKGDFHFFFPKIDLFILESLSTSVGGAEGERISCPLPAEQAGLDPSTLRS